MLNQTEWEHAREAFFPQAMHEGFPAEEEGPAYTANNQGADEEGGIPDVGFYAGFLEGKDYEDGGCGDKA